MVENHERKLKENMAAAKQAAIERDEDTRRDLMVEAKEAKEAIAKLEAERANQAVEYRRFQNLHGGTEEEGCAEAKKERLIAPSFLGTLTPCPITRGNNPTSIWIRRIQR